MTGGSSGALLREARERAGRTIEDLARATRIHPRYLAALEAGEGIDQPDVYRRTFVKSYARALGLDPEEVAALDGGGEEREEPRAPASVLEELSGEPPVEAAVATPVSRNPFAEASQLRTMAIVVILLVTALILSIQWLGPHDGEPRTAEPGPGAAAAPPSAPRLGAFARGEDPATGGVRAAAGDSLVLRAVAAESVWVHVVIDSDSTGEYTLPPGYVLTLRARDNFLLAVGNPAGLSLSLNGRTLEEPGTGTRPRKNILLSRKSLPD